MALQQQNDFHITQYLISRYYKHILGPSSGYNSSSNGPRGKKLRLDEQTPSARGFSSIISFFTSLIVGDYEKDVLIEKIKSEKRHAMSYDEWKSAGLRLDTLTNKNAWKEELETNHYDYNLIKNHTRQLRERIEKKEYAQLLYLIRTTWVRNLGGMGNVNLYRQTHVGTKFAIDEYMKESKLALDALVEDSDLDPQYLLGILQQTRRNIGRTALVLSGGGTFGLFHIGVLATLFELDLLPKVISGSSAGAIVASILSVHQNDEIPALLDKVLESDFNIFKDDKDKSESENFLIKISRFFKDGTWFDNKHLINTMIGFLGDLTFREAYNRTGKILNITVSPATIFEQPRLLNNLTAPNVLIWSAVCASCSLPGVFPSTALYEKNPKTGEKREWNGKSSVKYVDGSVDNDLPISRLSEMFNIDHIIACQVNLHVFPILKFSLSCVGGDIEDEFSAKFKQNLSRMYSMISNEIIHLLEIGSELGIAKNLLTKLRSVLSQQYSGNITILPEMKMLLGMNEVLVNPTKEFLLRQTTNGARATWPKVSIIEAHCGQEFALEKAIRKLKGRVFLSSSIHNPLQFSSKTVSLISYPDHNKSSEENNPRSMMLDENMLESTSTNVLIKIRERAGSFKDSIGDSIHQLNYSPLTISRHQKRLAEVPTRNRHTSSSFSYSTSPKAKNSQRSPKTAIYTNRNHSNSLRVAETKNCVARRKQAFERMNGLNSMSIIMPSTQTGRIEEFSIRAPKPLDSPTSTHRPRLNSSTKAGATKGKVGLDNRNNSRASSDESSVLQISDSDGKTKNCQESSSTPEELK